MLVKIGIFISMALLTVNGYYFGQRSVFRHTEDMYAQDQNGHVEDSETYFDAIKDTFDLYYRDKRYKNGKVCRSDQTGLDIGDKMSFYYKLAKNFNRSCSYVIGNLVIAHISNEDISFLDSIKEVSGYIFIFNNTAKSITLKSLEVIRGENAFFLKGKKYALAVCVNEMAYLVMPNLQVILRHDILIFESPALCYMKMINWDSLLSEPQKVLISVANESCLAHSENVTDARFTCHSSCPRWRERQFCWSNSSSACQKINKCRNEVCSKGTKCYINPIRKTEECCDEQCAGGCSGYGKGKCLACKNFNNDGACVEYCPRQLIYKNNKKIKNPEGKLAFHNLCVEKCPVRFFNEYGNCVLNCTAPNTYPVNETCVECPNKICPKVCHMNDVMHDKHVDFLNRIMLDRLQNCTVYDGNIIINSLSFKGDAYNNMSEKEYGIRSQDLANLQNLQEIYGYLEVNSVTSPTLKSLLFLKNLKIIRANNIVSDKRYGILISGNKYLKILGLRSLTEVENGDVIIRNNPSLCYTNTLTNQSIRHRGAIKISRNGISKCVTHRKCHTECDKQYGCWGPTYGLCVKCQNYLVGSRLCVPDCSMVSGFYNGYDKFTEKNERKCLRCHPQCNNGTNTCSGPNGNECNNGCRNYLRNDYCVEECPLDHFAEDTQCLPCHPDCSESSDNSSIPICNGPKNTLESGGCLNCNYVLLHANKSHPHINRLQCVNESYACPDGFFQFFVEFSAPEFLKKMPKYISTNPDLAFLVWDWFHNKTEQIDKYGSICLPCNPACSICIDGSDSGCKLCKFFQVGEQCAEKCPREYYTSSSNDTDGEVINKCLRCHQECKDGCTGPTNADCFECRHVKIFLEESSNKFICNETCADVYPNSIKSGIICHKNRLIPSWFHILFFVIASLLVTFCGLMVVIYFIVSLRKKQEYDRRQIKFDKLCHSQIENSPTIQPNMATLLLIEENQLTRGAVIGSGAFGIVYKAMWQPNLEKIDKSNSFLKRSFTRFSQGNVIKLPVAVKVLTDISDTSNMQVLEEAKVMASVDHSCCLRLLGVCITSHPQLITQFMPLGCLLEFCQKQRNFINNALLLNWAKQISFGMEYLESKGIIHCDLAARNVLVQSPQQVKITDFGLAKMLDQSQQHYQFEGGRMPIKWLAIECIKHRLFSSKSDVWSFGVTLWEMFTFGEKPFQKIKAFEILSNLEKGHRLSQPIICSLDVYSVMVQCWHVDPEVRPSFSELSKCLETMTQNPNRYLLIQNSPDIGSMYRGFESDALRYDEFLQVLTSVPQINLQYDSLDQSIDDKLKIRTVRNCYRELCSYNNSFVNYVNEWRASGHNSTTALIQESQDIYNPSNWSEYSREDKRMSNTTLLTNVNTSIDYASVTPMALTNLSEDGYLIPTGTSIIKRHAQPFSFRPSSQCYSKMAFNFGDIHETEELLDHQSPL